MEEYEQFETLRKKLVHSNLELRGELNLHNET